MIKVQILPCVFIIESIFSSCKMSCSSINTRLPLRLFINSIFTVFSIRLLVSLLKRNDKRCSKRMARKIRGRIFNKAQIVKNANKFFFYIPRSAKKIYQITPGTPVKLNGKRINGKVPAVQVKLVELHSTLGSAAGCS